MNPAIAPQHYATVARAIRYIRAQALRQPALEEIATHVGLSPFHLQRVFSEWAGISPKRFLQYLTRRQALESLAQSKTALDTAWDAGLSGSGRLHDLLVTCDAMTPGEIRRRGAGLTIRYGYAPSPLGDLIIGSTARGICHLHFVMAGRDAAAAELRTRWPAAEFTHDDDDAQHWCARIFAPALPDSADRQTPLPLLLRGSEFQLKVWEALLRVPVGECVSYSTLAAMAGAPKAQRAVGSALAKNDLGLLIPCHRVLRENGDFGEYRWGSERKAALFICEQQRPASAVPSPSD